MLGFGRVYFTVEDWIDLNTSHKIAPGDKGLPPGWADKAPRPLTPHGNTEVKDRQKERRQHAACQTCTSSNITNVGFVVVLDFVLFLLRTLKVNRFPERFVTTL